MELLSLVGKRIQHVRESRGLTQEGLGNLTGLNANYVSSIERGTVNSTIKTLEKIAQGLKVEIFELFLFSEPFGSKSEVEKALTSLIPASDKRTLMLCLHFLQTANQNAVD